MSAEDLKIGLVGAGYFGKIILRSLAETGVVPMFVADPAVTREDISAAVGDPELVDKVTLVTDIEPLLQDLDAVLIATPPDTHVDLIIKSLNANTHVFCEKPLVVHDPTKATHTIGFLYHESRDRGLVIHVDHTLCYCPKRLDAMSKGEHVLAIRENPDLNKHGLSVVWDLLIHEVAAALLVSGRLPDNVRIKPQDPTRDRVEVTLDFGTRVWDIRCENGSCRRRELYVDDRPIETTAEPLVEDVSPVVRSLVEFVRCVNPYGASHQSPTGIAHALNVSGVLERIEDLVSDSMEAP